MRVQPSENIITIWDSSDKHKNYKPLVQYRKLFFFLIIRKIHDLSYC